MKKLITFLLIVLSLEGYSQEDSIYHYYKEITKDLWVWDNNTNGSISGSSTKLVINKSTNQSKGSVVAYRWYANDSAGNMNMSLLRTFSVANTIPTVPIITSPYDGEVNNSRRIEFYSTDTDGDTITYKIYINNSLNIAEINIWYIFVFFFG